MWCRRRRWGRRVHSSTSSWCNLFLRRRERRGVTLWAGSCRDGIESCGWWNICSRVDSLGAEPTCAGDREQKICSRPARRHSHFLRPTCCVAARADWRDGARGSGGHCIQQRRLREVRFTSESNRTVRLLGPAQDQRQIWGWRGRVLRFSSIDASCSALPAGGRAGSEHSACGCGCGRRCTVPYR